MKILVGYTGFVGGNLHAQTSFDAVYNSKNIKDAYNTSPDILVYCGVKAEKFIANQNPDADLEHIKEAMQNIAMIKAKKVILISTIDVYANPKKVFETTPLETHDEGISVYGRHRLLLEEWVKQNTPSSHIIRLPGLFGQGLKKNFIYDYCHPVPAKLSKKIYSRLSPQSTDILRAYTYNENTQLYDLNQLASKEEMKELEIAFKDVGFSSLSFTDSRSIFQFYPLNRLWQDIETVLSFDLPVINLATEPIGIAELYHALTQKTFTNEVALTVPHYDFQTLYAHCFGAKGPYMMAKESVIIAIKDYVEAYHENSHL